MSEIYSFWPIIVGLDVSVKLLKDLFIYTDKTQFSEFSLSDHSV